MRSGAVSNRSCKSPTIMVAACSSSAATHCCSGSLPRATSSAPAVRRWRCAGYCAMSVASKCRARGSRCGWRRPCTRGEFHFFAVGTSHIELLPTGPGWSRLVAMEQAADAGEILLSTETAALLPGRCTGDSKGPGMLLQRAPPGHTEKLPLRPRPAMPYETVAQCLSPPIRAHVLGGGGMSEHRAVTIAFIRFEGTDALIERSGPDATAEALQRLVSVVQAAADEQEVTFLGSDVDADGGKLILTAGAPRITGRRRRAHVARAAQDRRYRTPDARFALESTAVRFSLATSDLSTGARTR